jgi:uncharacterized membrane protein YgaE (UPF0421/DUF939 family)
MSETVVVGLLAFLGTVIGSVVSIVTSNTLTNYKIDELKKQVEKHNNLIERTFRLEERESVLETKVEQLEKGGVSK